MTNVSLTEYKIGDHVKLCDGGEGIIKYVGIPHFSNDKQIYYGIEFTNHNTGNNNGTVHGHTYFTVLFHFFVFFCFFVCVCGVCVCVCVREKQGHTFQKHSPTHTNTHTHTHTQPWIYLISMACKHKKNMTVYVISVNMVKIVVFL